MATAFIDNDLSWKALVTLAELSGPSELSADAWHRIRRAFDYLGSMVDAGAPIYGMSTGFGADVSVSTQTTFADHQLHLLEYLCVGVGEPLAPGVVRRALRLQALKVSHGNSGITPEVIERLLKLAAARELPPVPCLGSLGASGDLVPMAHAIRPIFQQASPVGPRDVLGLVNTNSMMASFAVELLERVRRYLRLATQLTAGVAAALVTPFEHFSNPVFSQPSQPPAWREAGEGIASVLKKIRHDFRISQHPEVLQERYSVRCSTQILAAARNQLDFAESLIMQEAVAVADNPVIDLCGHSVHHAGMFYSVSLAVAVDQCADVTARLAELLERQSFLLVLPELSHGLPRNLETAPGDHLKGIHQLMNALGQRIRGMVLPSRMLVAPAEGYNQDVVPGTMTALVQLESALKVFDELTRAASFLVERAVHLRAAMPLPSRLCLASWSKYITPEGIGDGV